MPRPAGAPRGDHRRSRAGCQHRASCGGVARRYRARRRCIRMLVPPRHGWPGLLLDECQLAWRLLSDRGHVRAGRPGQVVQLEVLSTDQRSTFAKALLAIWVKRSTE